MRDRRRHRVDLTGNPGREADALALAKKLRSAVSIVDTLFANIAGEERDKERFVLVNEKHRFESMYEYFQMRCKALGKEHNQLQKRSIPSRKSGRKGTSKKTVSDHLSDIAKHFNHSTRLLKEVEYNTLAAVGAYFSMTEVIMDAKYCMMEKQVTYKEFRRLDWYERMKSLATWTNEELKVILDVKRIRDSMRNRSFHFAPIYYFPMPLVGLIPASYENLTPQGFGDFPSRETLGVSASTFTKLDSLLDLLKASPETELSYLYADSSLPLMLDFAQDSLSGHTGSKRKFKEEILRRNRMQDAIDNMEV